MKKIIFLYLLISFSGTSSGQFPASVDSVYSFIKYNSVFRNTVDWNEIDKSFKDNITKASSLNDTMKCFVEVLKALNDVHTQIYLDNRYFGHYQAVDDSTYKRMKPLRERSLAVTGKIYTASIEKKYVYVMVPAISAYGAEQINNYGQAINDSICKYSSQKIKGFIIDLRLNSGGNMYPMLGGLSSLLGNTVVGYETDVNDSIVRKWEIRNRNFIIGGYQATDIKKSCDADHGKIPVVVLIGPMTGSSGSMAAIAFKKRPNSYFIGEPTADGYTTSNGYFQFAPNLTLNFATNFVADRSKTVYKATVNPDITVYGGDNFDLLLKDEKIRSALVWLGKNK